MHHSPVPTVKASLNHYVPFVLRTFRLLGCRLHFQLGAGKKKYTTWVHRDIDQGGLVDFHHLLCDTATGPYPAKADPLIIAIETVCVYRRDVVITKQLDRV